MCDGHAMVAYESQKIKTFVDNKIMICNQKIVTVTR